jgi:hypothetical protein
MPVSRPSDANTEPLPSGYLLPGRSATSARARDAVTHSLLILKHAIRMPSAPTPDAGWYPRHADTATHSTSGAQCSHCRWLGEFRHVCVEVAGVAEALAARAAMVAKVAAGPGYSVANSCRAGRA